MIHPDTYIMKTPKGMGVFTTRKFRMGEILWIADDFDVKIPLEAYESLDKIQKTKLNRYSYLDSENRVIVPWDEGKYVNHSCSPNSTSTLEYDNISIAVTDIEKDVEIVEDYYSYFGHFETFECFCGSPNCRKFIGQGETYDSELRIELAEMAPVILGMDQPLLRIKSVESQQFKECLNSFAKQNGKIRKRA